MWSNWESTEPQGGFDAVIGNPPWDRIKFQEVEWFAAREPEIAHHAQRASDRKKLVETLKKERDPLALAARGGIGCRSSGGTGPGLSDHGDYPLLSGGDTNIYSLFVERAPALSKRMALSGC